MIVPYPFLRPLLNVNLAWAGVDLELFPAEIPDGELAATGITHLAQHNRSLPRPVTLPWLIPGDREIYARNSIATQLPVEQLILTLPDGELDQDLSFLRHPGFRIAALADSNTTLNHLIQRKADWAVLDARQAHENVSPLELARAKEAGLVLVARQVRNNDLLAWCGARGFHLVSNEFLFRPDEVDGTVPDPAKLRLLKILSLIVQDADTRELEELFKQEAKLSYNLLRLVNSVSLGVTTRISSFGQAITLLGRRQLQRWLQLLIYAHQFSEEQQPNPLMQQAALRGALMERLAMAAAPDKAEDRDFRDCAYMVGAFSLLNILLHLSMSDILAALPLTEEVQGALAAHAGQLGHLLAILEHGDRGEFALAVPLLETEGISPTVFGALQIDALAWAGQVALA